MNRTMANLNSIPLSVRSCLGSLKTPCDKFFLKKHHFHSRQMAENPLAPDLHNPAQPAPAVQPQAPDVVMQDIPPQAAQPRA